MRLTRTRVPTGRTFSRWGIADVICSRDPCMMSLAGGAVLCQNVFPTRPWCSGHALRRLTAAAALTRSRRSGSRGWIPIWVISWWRRVCCSCRCSGPGGWSWADVVACWQVRRLGFLWATADFEARAGSTRAAHGRQKEPPLVRIQSWMWCCKCPMALPSRRKVLYCRRASSTTSANNRSPVLL